MDISTAYIEERFQHFNILCFEGKLVLPPIRLSNSRRAFGQVRCMRRHRLDGMCEFYNFDFAISELLAKGMDEQQVDDTILHEMIHYYILSNQMHDTSAHGVLFRREMNRINRAFHRHIAISHRFMVGEQGNMEVNDKRQNVVAVFHLHDGRWGMMVVARTRVWQLWSRLESIPDVKQAYWFISCHPFFSQFPRRTTLKYYPMDSEDLIDKLGDACLLMRRDGRIVVSKCDIKTFVR